MLKVPLKDIVFNASSYVFKSYTMEKLMYIGWIKKMFLQNITHSILSLFNQNSAPVSIKTRSSYNCLSDKMNSVLRPPKLVLSLHFDDRKKDAMVYFANMSISEGSMAFTCAACRDGNAYSRDGQSLADCDHRTFFYKQPNTRLKY